MFRVLERAIDLAVVAPPRRSRTAAPQTHPTGAGPEPVAPYRLGPPSLETAFPSPIMPSAPWGEPNTKLPFVVITTQPWPEQWWRAPRVRAGVPESTTAAARAAGDPLAVGRLAATEPPASIGISALPAGSAHEQRAARGHDRRRWGDRRGTFARLAVVGVGLLVSLVAVEAAARRRG